MLVREWLENLPLAANHLLSQQRLKSKHMKTKVVKNYIIFYLNRLNLFGFACLLLFSYSCQTNEEDAGPTLTSHGFDMKVTGNFDRNMQGTNATFKILQMPSNFVTSHQLAIYLIDSEGYVVTATILINGDNLPIAGMYVINPIISGGEIIELKANDGGLLFGQNGGISYSVPGGGGGNITLTETGIDFVKGTINGGLKATGTGSGTITIQGGFYASLDQ